MDKEEGNQANGKVEVGDTFEVPEEFPILFIPALSFRPNIHVANNQRRRIIDPNFPPGSERSLSSMTAILTSGQASGRGSLHRDTRKGTRWRFCWGGSHGHGSKMAFMSGQLLIGNQAGRRWGGLLHFQGDSMDRGPNDIHRSPSNSSPIAYVLIAAQGFSF